MSCKCVFPAPSIECTWALVNGVRAGDPLPLSGQRACCLTGGILSTIGKLDVDEPLPDDLMAKVAALQAVLESVQASGLADEQIWEIIIPIVIPIAFELLKLLLERRRGGR
jgi:hypothetical protein